MEKYKVSIKRIDWLDMDNPEAEVYFEINKKHLWAFCQPCDFRDGELADVSFSIIEEEISESSFWNENKQQLKDIIPSKRDRCSYYCYGKLNSIHPVIIDCGAITFSFGDWINDESMIGSYVYFVISRLDIGRIK